MLVKMPLETTQMLCTAHRELDGDEYADRVGLYKTAYKNHPCTIWARESSSNYWWLVYHFLALSDEYKYRYGREHASYLKLQKPLCVRPRNIKVGSMTTVAQAMPDKYKHPDPHDLHIADTVFTRRLMQSGKKEGQARMVDYMIKNVIIFVMGILLLLFVYNLEIYLV